jgi:hypothetical protein
MNPYWQALTSHALIAPHDNIKIQNYSIPSASNLASNRIRRLIQSSL